MTAASADLPAQKRARSKYTQAMSYAECDRLKSLESGIADEFAAFRRVGLALLEIRDSKLYRGEHVSFAAYAQARWNVSHGEAYRLIRAAEIAIIVSPIGDISHKTHVLPLSPLEPEQQRIVWEVVKLTAPNGQVTEGHVRSLVNILREIVVTGAIDDGSGEDMPIEQAQPEHLKAAVIQEYHERMLRQQQHIIDGIVPKTRLVQRFDWSTPAAAAAKWDALIAQLQGLRDKNIIVTVREVVE